MYCAELKPYIKWHEMLAISLGQWPYLSPLIKIVVRTVLGFFYLSLIVPVVICFYKARHDLDYFIECLPMTITCVIVCFYFIFYIIKNKELLHLINHISDDFKALQSFEVEFEILKESAKEGRFASLAYIVYTILSIIIFVGMTLMPQILNIIVPLDESRPNSYMAEVDYVIFDKDEYYLFSYFHATIVGTCSIINILTADVMLYFFTQHACGMFRVLQYRLKRVTEIIVADSINYKENMERELLENAITCVKMYQRILDYIESINSCFSFCLLVTIGITILLLTFQGAVIIFKLDEKDVVLRCGAYGLGQIVHLFYNCISGQILVNHSNNVTNFIYETQWYSTSRKIQKIFQIMMIRSLKESQVKIGNMFILCFETYTSIMKTVFSYLSVLTSVKK